MKYVLTIDQGTTSTRAIIYDENRKIVSNASCEFTQYFPKEGYVEHDALEIWQTVQEVIAKVMIESKVSKQDIISLGITNQRETTVIWDKHTGEPIYHAIVWQSRQSSEICQRLSSHRHVKMIKNKTGLKIDSYFSASKIAWLLENVSGASEKAKNGELLFGTIDSWLIWNLTGGKVHATDYSNASRTMLFNIHELKWDHDLLELFNIPSSMLPEVKNSSDDYGVTTRDNFFGYELPINGVAGDQHAALYGQECYEAGMVKNTYGTGCFMLMNTKNQAISSTSGLLTTIAWSVNDEVTYALEGSVFVAGSAIQWLRDGLKIIESAKDCEAMIAKADSNQNIYVVPAFVGLGTPYWDSEVRGSIFGLNRGTSDYDLVKATVESIAYQTRDVLEQMTKDSGIPINVLKVDGGASQNNYLMQFQADILNRKITRPSNLESTSLGVALLAGKYHGLYQKLEEVYSGDSFLARMDGVTRSRLYTKWQKAVEAARIFK